MGRVATALECDVHLSAPSCASRIAWLRPLPFATVLVAGTGLRLMTLGDNGVVDRHRPAPRDAIPPDEPSPSLPSGHAATATVRGLLASLLMLEQRSKQLRSRRRPPQRVWQRAWASAGC